MSRIVVYWMRATFSTPQAIVLVLPGATSTYSLLMTFGIEGAPLATSAVPIAFLFCL